MYVTWPAIGCEYKLHRMRVQQNCNWCQKLCGRHTPKSLPKTLTALVTGCVCNLNVLRCLSYQIKCVPAQFVRRNGCPNLQLTTWPTLLCSALIRFALQQELETIQHIGQCVGTIVGNNSTSWTMRRNTSRFGIPYSPPKLLPAYQTRNVGWHMIKTSQHNTACIIIALPDRRSLHSQASMPYRMPLA